MHPTLLSILTILAAKAASAAVAATTAKKATGTNPLIYLIPLLAIAYLLILRPQRKRQQAARQGTSTIVEGDTVATIGGIVGTVISIDSERAVLQVGPDMELEFLRQAVARKVEPVVHEADDDDGDADDDVAEDDEDEDRGWHGYHPEDVDDHPEDEGEEAEASNDAKAADAADLGAAFGVSAGPGPSEPAPSEPAPAEPGPSEPGPSEPGVPSSKPSVSPRPGQADSEESSPE